MQATDIVKLLDTHTNEQVSYYPITTWADGSVMDDSKVDNVIYRKAGNGYYKRAFTAEVNVKWFGAKGDGVTDDTAALVAAIDYVKTIKNGVLYIPKGIYNYTDLGNIANSYMTIRGDGINISVLQCTAQNTVALTVDAWAISRAFVYNFQMRDITISGNNTTTDILYLKGIAQSKFEHVSVKNGNPTTGKGWSMWAIQLCAFDKCVCSINVDPTQIIPATAAYLMAATRPGDSSGTQPTNSKWDQCYFEGAVNGFQLMGGTNNTFIGGAIEGNSAGGLLINSGQPFNVFIGIGFENPSAVYDVQDGGWCSKFINCYVDTNFIITGGSRYCVIDGGRIEQIQMATTPVSPTIQNIYYNLKGTSTGIANTGINMTKRNCYNLTAGTTDADIVSVAGSINASGNATFGGNVQGNAYGSINASDGNIQLGNMAQGALVPFKSTVGTNFPYASGVGLEVSRTMDATTGSSVGTFKLWCANDGNNRIFFRKLTGANTWGVWVELISTATLQAYLPAATTAAAGVVKKSAALTSPVPANAAGDTPTAAEFNAVVAYINELVTNQQAAGQQS